MLCVTTNCGFFCPIGSQMTLKVISKPLHSVCCTDTAPATGFQTSSFPYCSPVCVLAPPSALALSLKEWGLEDLLPLLYLKSVRLECAVRCNTCNLNEQLSKLKAEHPCFLIRHLQQMVPPLQRTVQLKKAHLKPDYRIYFCPWINTLI